MWLEHKKQAIELAEQTAEFEEEKQRLAEMQAAKGQSLMEKLGKKSGTIVRARAAHPAKHPPHTLLSSHHGPAHSRP